jgi:hypothetical protein
LPKSFSLRNRIFLHRFFKLTLNLEENPFANASDGRNGGHRHRPKLFPLPSVFGFEFGFGRIRTNLFGAGLETAQGNLNGMADAEEAVKVS